MKVQVDYTRCTGHGLCEIEAEDVFEVGPDGVTHLLIEEPSEEQRTGVEEAVKVCPTGALSLEQ